MKVNHSTLLTALFASFILLVIYHADRATNGFLVNIVEDIPFGDKMGHFSLYGIMAMLLDQTMRRKSTRIMGFNFSKAAVYVFSFAAIEEISQLWISNRRFEWFDLLFDLLGILIIVALGRRYIRNTSSLPVAPPPKSGRT